MKRHLLFALAACLAQTALSDNLLHDLTDGKYKAKTLPALHSMNDGKHYTVMTDSATVVRYSYKTGEATDTLFQLSKIKDAPIQAISGYKFSPNEELILVHTNAEYRYRHSFTADYYLYDIKRNELRQLSEYGKQEAPAFSPDSRYVAFVRENNIYLRKLDFNTELAITKDGEAGKVINGVPDWVYEEEFGVNRYFEWSPDSKMIAFLKFDETAVPKFSFQLYNHRPDADGLTLYPDYLTFKYPKAGQTNSKVKVFVYDDYNKNTREIKLEGEEDFYIPRIRWTKSAEQLAVFRLNRNQNRLDMYLANPKSTIAKLTLSEEDKYYVDYAQIDDIYFTDDNRSFLYVSERDGYRHIYRYRMNGLLDKQLTSGTWDVTALYGYDEKKGILYYQAAEASPMQRDVYALDAKGRTTRLTDGKGIHHAAFNSTLSNFIDNHSTLNTPNRMVLRSAAKGKELRVLEDNAELARSFAALGLPQKEFFRFTTDEQVGLNGWMLKPANFNPATKYPLLLVQYSGPNSQQVLDNWKPDWEYYLSQQGYVVACVDGRGTGARGAEFRKCTYQRLGVLETQDQIAAARYLGTQPYIDPARIGIWGWSYGGFMTLMALSAPDTPFRAGIAVAPVTDWRLYNTAYTERFMRRPQENFAGYDEASPLLRADQLQGKLLIVHGTADDNVHIQNTMLYIEKLVEADKQFEMQIYTDKNHSILGKQTRRHLYTRKCEFLFRNL